LMPGNHRINFLIDENGANSCRMSNILEDERIVKYNYEPFSYWIRKGFLYWVLINKLSMEVSLFERKDVLWLQRFLVQDAFGEWKRFLSRLKELFQLE
jgi:hypothetical protein